MPYLSGLTTGAALIIAIGAQNAFVLSNGIRRNHILVIILICIACDAILIYAGVSGVGRVIGTHPLLADLTLWGGALFLTWYGIRSLISACRSNSLEETHTTTTSLTTIVLSTLAVTLLNPHVYLDTMILIGTIGSQFATHERGLFSLGAITASVIWFTALGYGGQRLAPLFKNTLSWKILDVSVGVLMLVLATSLLWPSQT